IDAVQHFGDGEVGVVHTAEYRYVQRVEADRDAGEARRLQRPRFLYEDRAVSGEREVEPRNVGEHLDQTLEAPAQEWLAAGQADFLVPMAFENARQPCDRLASTPSV